MNEHHGVPTTAELVAAVREFLHGDVMAETAGRLSFNARVAGNVLAIVERELERGSEVDDAHRDDLRALGFADDAELAAAIRDGHVQLNRELLVVLRRYAAAQLAIVNPRHLRDGDPVASHDQRGPRP